MKTTTIDETIALLKEHATAIRESGTVPFHYDVNTFSDEESKADYEKHLRLINELKELKRKL